MEILKKTGKFLLGVVIGVAIMMFADRYYVKGKRLVADNLPKEPVEYVNPYMGNISHLLVPTYPTVHLPNSMLRVYPERGDFTGDRLGGLPLIVTSHRGSSAFNLSPYQGDEAGLKPVIQYSYDREKIVPYRYQVYLDEANIEVDYAPSHQSAVYSLKFEKDGPAYLVFNSRNGELKCDGNTVSGFQYVDKKTKVYLYAETDKKPEKSGILASGTVKYGKSSVEGKDAALALAFSGQKEIGVRYGISFISTEQARKNLEREINSYDVSAIARIGRNEWNDALGKIQVSGGSENDKTVFYTSLYRCYERPVNLSEDGKYYSAFDGKIHEDGGRSFYTDDWIWDTYRATHPLRILIDKECETDIINSYLLMAQQMGTNWMPTFPEVTGDSRRMNSNHAVATVIDAWRKGVRGFDLEKAYEAARKGIEEKTLIPWSAAPSGWLDEFYKEVNHVRNSFIRTEADELTYCFHIILRYEIEKAIFRDHVKVEELPALWNQKMQEYLQITPADDAEGILQDMHWSDGSFGYFPSYLLGSIYDGMYLDRLEEELGSVDALLAEGRISEITKWLNEKIHQYGSTRSPKEVIRYVCGKEVSAEPLIRYFKEKYTKVYNLG